ncbi:MAG TPA: hypothetical protein VIV11_42140 [Kofleriaceae bacterium]
MRARGWWLPVLLAFSTSAAADPKPKAVDIKPIRDQLIVLTDGDGGIYIAQPGRDGKLFYGVGGKNKNVYEQIVISRSSDGTTGAWDVGVWAPRVSNVRPGTVGKRRDGSYERSCGHDDKTPLTELTGDKAKAVLDKSVFLTSAMIRKPYLLARDDAAVYYYVDVIRDQYGGKGHRVFIGKKGAMKQKPLTDVTTDTAGDVFATKTGDLRIVRDTTDGKNAVSWVKGEKRVQLFWLDVDANSPLIWKDLGVYGFTGSICESI